MYSFIIILVVLASVLMCCIVLIQESKGGGLAADYSSNNQILGAPKTTNFVEKATWYLAAAMIVFSIISVAFLPKAKVVENRPAPQETSATNIPGMGQAAATTPAAEAVPAEATQAE